MSKVRKIAINIGATLAMPAAIYIFFAIITRLASGDNIIAFGSANMFFTILQNSCLGILVAFALCINMPTFRIDMSVGAVVVLTSIIATSLTLEYHLSIWTMLIFSIAIAMILCLITSVAYVLLRIPMMVLSIGLVIVYEALTGIVFGGHGVAALAPDTRLLGYQPWCFILVIAAMIVFHIITEYTQYAYSTKLLAGGQAMAVRIGVNEVKNVIQGFLICGFFLGLASMVYISNYGLVEAVSNMGSGTIMFNSLLPVIIGLILANFSCRAVGVAVSVISMKTISYGLFCLGFNSTVQDVVSGTFILVLVIVMGALAMAPEKRRVNARAKALTAIKSA